MAALPRRGRREITIGSRLADDDDDEEETDERNRTLWRMPVTLMVALADACDIGKDIAGPQATGSLVQQQREEVDSDAMSEAAFTDTGGSGKGIADLEGLQLQQERELAVSKLQPTDFATQVSNLEHPPRPLSPKDSICCTPSLQLAHILIELRASLTIPGQNLDSFLCTHVQDETDTAMFYNPVLNLAIREFRMTRVVNGVPHTVRSFAASQR